jgi:hypothetical protein
MVGPRGPRVAAAAASFALAAAFACRSAAPPPKPPAPDPAEEALAALTAGLKLDAAQQQKTRELLKEMAARNDRMSAAWANGERVRPEMLLASRAQFEQDFQAILTEPQRRVFLENRMRLMLLSKGFR